MAARELERRDGDAIGRIEAERLSQRWEWRDGDQVIRFQGTYEGTSAGWHEFLTPLGLMKFMKMPLHVRDLSQIPHG